MAPSRPDPVILVHGQPGGARDWDAVTAAIGGRAEAIAIDRPGWDGHSVPAGLAENAAAVVAMLNARGVDRATIVGHSFGAAVAIWVAVNHPERVRGLVLAAPSANAASLFALDRWLAAPLTGDLVSAAGLAGVGLVLAAKRARRRIAWHLALQESYLEAAGRVLRSPASWRAFVTEQRVLVDELPGLELQLGRISAPTTIVIGSADLVVPAHSARQLANQISGAGLVVLERAGHLLPLQHPAPLAEIIVQAAGR